ncbi:MAG: hypothetical protein WA160_06930 [Pseudobdellovibrio sp.]
MHKLFFAIMLLSSNSFAFIQFIEKAADFAQNLEIYLDSMQDLAESVDETNSVNQTVSSSSRKMSAIRNTLKDLNYTQQEIKDIVDSEGVENSDLPSQLNRISNKIRRGKNIYKRLMLLAGAKPEAVIAGESLKSTAILKDIQYELVMFRSERQLDRQAVLAEKLQKKKNERDLNIFFVSQLELMQRKGASPIAYSKFKIDSKGL